MARGRNHLILMQTPVLVGWERFADPMVRGGFDLQPVQEVWMDNKQLCVLAKDAFYLFILFTSR